MTPTRKLDPAINLLDTEIDPRDAVSGLASRVPVIGPLLTDMINPQRLMADEENVLQDFLTGKRLNAMPQFTPLTAQEVLNFAKKKKKPSETYSNWEKSTGMEGMDLYEGTTPGPAIPDTPDIPERFDPNLGKRKGVPKPLVKAMGNKRIREKIKDFARQGKAIMGDSRWYQTGPLYQLYEDELGPEKAREKFTKDIQFLASTSQGMSLPNNVRVSSYYQYLDEQGLPLAIPPKGSGYGAKTQQGHLKGILDIKEKGELDYMANPKRATFANNLLGNESQVTIDKHNVRMLAMLTKDPMFLQTSAEIGGKKEGDADPPIVKEMKKKGIDVKETSRDGKIFFSIKPRQAFNDGKLTMARALKSPVLWREAPTDSEYGAYEKYQQDIAKELGMTPAEFQEATWLGAGGMTGLESPPETAIETIQKRVKYTADMLGKDPEMVMRQYIRGEIPLAQMDDMMTTYGGLLA